MCQNSHPTPSQHTAHASLKVGNLLSSRLCLKAYLQTHLWFQTCMQGHIPQGVPVGHPTAPGEGTQVWQVVFHGRAGQPSWKTPLVPASSSHGLGNHPFSSLQWDFDPKLLSCFLSFTNRFSSESSVVLVLFCHKRSALPQNFTNA